MVKSRFSNLVLLPAMMFAMNVMAGGKASLSEATTGYVLVWNDEFNGTTLDEDAWNVEINGNGGGNAELQYYLRDNVTIEKEPASGENCLVLTAKNENYEGKQFTSGRLNSYEKVYFTHGMVESRIKMPQTGNGLWPAFWLLGNDYTTNIWPRCGEIDIVEMGNAEGIGAGTQDRYFNGACHWGYYKGSAYPNYARSSTCSYSLQDGEFHLFTLVWDENKLSMYLDRDKYPDANPYYEMNLTDYSDDWAVGNYFHKDFFIVFDLAVGGRFTGILSPTGITALNDGDRKMYIDYVRVYKQANDDLITVPDSYAGVKGTEKDVANTIGRPRFFTLTGRPLSAEPQHGCYIIRGTNGEVRKVLRGQGQ